MITFFYKWLPIVFGCHCREDRSFHYHEKPFPVCARCTGELIGIFIAIGTAYFGQFKIIVLLCLLIPLIVDGFLQLLTSYESGNRRRFITGLLFGYGLTCLFIISIGYVYNFGYEYGLRSLN